MENYFMVKKVDKNEFFYVNKNASLEAFFSA